MNGCGLPVKGRQDWWLLTVEDGLRGGLDLPVNGVDGDGLVLDDDLVVGEGGGEGRLGHLQLRAVRGDPGGVVYNPHCKAFLKINEIGSYVKERMVSWSLMSSEA